MAQGLYEAGCRVAAAYPGTPSTEILESLAAYEAGNLHTEWSVNEKIALEVAAAASYAGLRSAAVMKQVGLNVALDPLMSLAYTGVAGGMVVIVADDPGPHSSQTEQDTRLIAMAAGVPVLDPATGEQAREMVHQAYDISEKYQVPVILRPVLRICHSRGPVGPVTRRFEGPEPLFIKDTDRWAATPKHRFTLHRELNRKLGQMRSDPLVTKMNGFWRGENGPADFAILASGVAAAYAMDALTDRGMADEVPLFVAGCPWPLSEGQIIESLGRYGRILVLEETSPFMEMLVRQRLDVSGRLDGLVPSEGEITPDVVEKALNSFLTVHGSQCTVHSAEVREAEPFPEGEGETTSPSPPTLCAGCPHRSSFWALKKAMPGAIYTGDIGCYTLGIELGVVDTVLCMGASISQAAGFYWAYRQSPGSRQPIAAVIGDSTFYHAGIPALVNAVQQGAAFVLLIVDNGTTAMTGCQPTPGSGVLLSGTPGNKVPLEDVVRGCGVTKLWITDSLDYEALTGSLKEAALAASKGQMAVVISRSPCVLNLRERQGPVPVIDRQVCNACGICTDRFGCRAIRADDGEFTIVEELCPGCGVCVHVCPRGAIVVKEGEREGGGER
ncbi:MAG: thiamine pyrophosphate-dependent enzyme [bacterium]|nr:thiamine pyrophosphate-dependent enzyme [bacterium]